MVAAPKPVTPRQVVGSSSDSEWEELCEPYNLSAEDRPRWRAFIAKVKRKERPFTPEEKRLYRKYGSPKDLLIFSMIGQHNKEA
jgi:hypothetical protein